MEFVRGRRELNWRFFDFISLIFLFCTTTGPTSPRPEYRSSLSHSKRCGTRVQVWDDISSPARTWPRLRGGIPPIIRAPIRHNLAKRKYSAAQDDNHNPRFRPPNDFQCLVWRLEARQARASESSSTACLTATGSSPSKPCPQARTRPSSRSHKGLKGRVEARVNPAAIKHLHDTQARASETPS